MGQRRQSFAFFVRGGDIQEDQFVGPLLAVEGAQLHGVTRIAQVDKIDTLYGAPVLDIQAGYDAFG